MKRLRDRRSPAEGNVRFNGSEIGGTSSPAAAPGSPIDSEAAKGDIHVRLGAADHCKKDHEDCSMCVRMSGFLSLIVT
jgi:hypothetical protein